MTREQMVALIKGFTEAVEARDIGSEDAAEYITEIFDRFDEEMWKPGDWPPGDTHSKLVTGGEGESRWFSLAWCVLGGDGWIHTSGIPMPQRVRHWRELPAPPKG